MGDETQQKKRPTRSHGSRGHRRPQSTFSGTTQDAAKEASSGACGGLFDDCRSEEHSKRKINRDDDDTGASKGRRSREKNRDKSRDKNHRAGDQDEIESDDSQDENFEVYPTKTVDLSRRIDSYTYQCQSANTNVAYQNHPTLPHMSASVRYQNSSVQVFQQDRSQSVLEERIIENNEEDEEEGGTPGVVIFGRKKTREITVKRVDDVTTIDHGLKSIYALVCIMFGAILFISCLQIILFVLLDTLPQNGGDDTSFNLQDDAIVRIVCAVLSLPGFVFGFSSMMTFASAFVADNWRSNRVLQAVGTDYSSRKSKSAMILSQ